MKHAWAMLLMAFALAQPAAAADKKYVFALVPKNTNNPFFDQARDGCKKAEKELNGAIECLYVGPGEHGGGEEQVQVVNDLIARRVDGIAVSPSNAPAMGRALAEAKQGGHSGADLGFRPAGARPEGAHRLCRHPQL